MSLVKVLKVVSVLPDLKPTFPQIFKVPLLSVSGLLSLNRHASPLKSSKEEKIIHHSKN
jgi:hypothetical protein